MNLKCCLCWIFWSRFNYQSCTPRIHVNFVLYSTVGKDPLSLKSTWGEKERIARGHHANLWYTLTHPHSQLESWSASIFTKVQKSYLCGFWLSLHNSFHATDAWKYVKVSMFDNALYYKHVEWWWFMLCTYFSDLKQSFSLKYYDHVHLYNISLLFMVIPRTFMRELRIYNNFMWFLICLPKFN